MTRAVWNGVVVAESPRTVVVEGNHYFPPESVRREYLVESPHRSLCPWKGIARYYTLQVGSDVNPDAAWYYPRPTFLARRIKHHVAFWNGVHIECHSHETLTLTPLGALTRGLVAGAAGTLAMDLVWFARYKRGGAEGSFVDWELSSTLCDWDEAPAPAPIGKRLVEGLFQREVPPERAAFTNNVVHWAYGILSGAQYGIVAGSLPTPRIAHGLAFGPVVWASGYVVLPLAKLYKPIWEYDAKTLARDLGAHVVYGLGTAAAFRLLARN